MRSRPASLPFASLALVALTSALPAQLDRHELGLRLRAYEQRLGACTDAAPRAASLRELDRAVQAFFRLDLEGVATAIEAADRKLSAAEPDAALAWARSLQLVVDARLCDPDGAPVPFTLRAAFATEAPVPADVELVLAIAGEAKPRLVLPVRELPCAGALPLSGLAAGDHELTWSLRVGERVLLQRAQGLSSAPGLAARLQALEAATETPPAEATLESATAALLAKTLGGMTKVRREETVFPGARLLADAQALVAAMAAGKPWYDASRAGEHWLRVPLARGGATVRLRVPKLAAEAGKRPIVVALHGAGGSENLFFDSYGAGAIVPLCQAREWFLVAPRSELLGSVDVPALVDALAQRWAIDPTRVLLIGHSMGAGQAMAAAARAPERFNAVALLGGGGSTGKGQGLAGRPFFVAAGERDFGRNGAQALHRSLVKAKADATWKLYDDVEHLAIVQFALPDVFAFYDAALQPRSDAGK